MYFNVFLSLLLLEYLHPYLNCSFLRVLSINKSIDLFTCYKRGLDRASKSRKFVKENISIIPVLGIKTASCGNMVTVARSCFGLKNTVQRVYYRQICTK